MVAVDWLTDIMLRMLPTSSSAAHSGPRAIPFQPPQGDLALLAGSANPVLAQAIANHLGVPLVPARAHVFSEGNVFVRVRENVRGRDVFVIQGVHQPVNDNFILHCKVITGSSTATSKR